jgi:glycosyltransferase involved in cell wall biosynthesis
MRVLVATDHAYPPQWVGGSESSIHDLCVALQARGIDVTVLCRLSWWHPIRSIRPAEALAWVGRRQVRDDGPGYPVLRARDPVAAIGRLARTLRPDAALLQVGRALPLAERLLAAGVPTIVYLRDAFFADLGGAIVSRPGLTYLATSRFLARCFAESYGVAAEPIPPLVEPTRYRTESQRRNVTFVCPLPIKGLDTALGLARERRDIPFVFLESWPLDVAPWRALRRRVRSIANVTLRRATDDMRSVYRDARIVLVPSECDEGWGRVVSEAQVSGIPALASVRGGLPESVGAGGILVDASAGLTAWSSALSRLWDDPTEYERLSQLALRHAKRADFAPDRIVDRLLAVLTAAGAARGLLPEAHRLG